MLGLGMGLISNPHRWHNDIPLKDLKEINVLKEFIVFLKCLISYLMLIILKLTLIIMIKKYIELDLCFGQFQWKLVNPRLL